MDETAGTVLKPQWEKFATEYARLGNASEAARVAGYAAAGAAVQGHQLLRNPKILARVRELQAEWHAEQVQAIKAHVAPAINALGGIVTNGGRGGDQAVVLAACALLDRAGFKPIERVETRQQTAVILLSTDDLEL